MRGYREDGRPTCPSCGQPFVSDEANLDDEGRPRCARCGELASVEIFEQRAHRARNVDRWKQSRTALAGLGIVAIIGVLVVRAVREGRAEAESEVARAQARRDLDARLDRLRPALVHDGRRATACDDGALRPLARAGGELWLRALRYDGQDLWDYRVASRELEAVTTGDAPNALASLRKARVLVVLLEGSMSNALVVVSLDTETALCWSPLHRARNTNRSARDEAADDLRSISQVITLAE